MLVLLRHPDHLCEFVSYLLGKYIQTESGRFFVFFKLSHIRFCVFPFCFKGHISGKKRKKEMGLFSICEFVHDQHWVKKSLPSTYQGTGLSGAWPTYFSSTLARPVVFIYFCFCFLLKSLAIELPVHGFGKTFDR